MFNFGKNWHNYSQASLDSKAVADAQDSLRDLIGRENFNDKTLLDLGCGSGLFSIAAAEMGAQVTAIDYNPLCVEITKQNAQRFLSDPGRLSCAIGSALDLPSLRAYGTFDIVYSWGVLHHTGAMWQAVDNALSMANEGGTVVLSLYNQHFTSPLWRGIKWTYVHMPGFGQRIMELMFGAAIFGAKWLVTGKNPLHKERGMNFWFDVVDWVGGYPYEYATLEAVVDFVLPRGYVLQRSVPAEVPTGCNEFVFVRQQT